MRADPRRGLYNNASEVVREGLRLLKEHDEVRLKWREQIERGWLQPTLRSASLNALERAFEQLAEMPESGHKRENRRVCAAPSVTRR